MYGNHQSARYCYLENRNGNELNEYRGFRMSIDIDLRRLRFFVEVVRQGGFSQAAKVVFAAQPTVSKAVKQLEDELGATLLNRIGHRPELTAAGKIVYHRGLALIKEDKDLVDEF